MLDHYYVMRPARNVSCDAEVTEGMRLEPIECAANPGHGRTRDVWGAITVDFAESDEADCLWTWRNDCLLDSGAIQELLNVGFRGIITHPVYAAGHQPTREYSLIRPGGWGGMARRESGVRLCRYHECCGHRQYTAVRDASKLIDSAQWDGADLFIVWPMPRYLFISQRMRDMLARMRLTGVELPSVAECNFGNDGFSPGQLSHYFDATRARELGGVLGID